MVVCIFLLAVALGMTVIIVGVLTKNVANTTNTGTSADAAAVIVALTVVICERGGVTHFAAP